MKLSEVAELLSIGSRTAENWIYAKTMPIVMFKLGSTWVANVSDVATYLDEQRADAIKLLQQRREAV